MRIESVKEAIGICLGGILADERTDTTIRQASSVGTVNFLEIEARCPDHTGAARISMIILRIVEMINLTKEMPKYETSTICALYSYSDMKFLGFTVTEIIESVLINSVIEGKADKVKMSDFIAGLNIPQLMLKFLKYTEHIDSKSNFDL